MTANQAIAATVRLYGNETIEAYQFPDGEVRYSIEGACKLLGISLELLSHYQRQLIALGFTGKVAICHVEGAAANTISRADVLTLARFATYTLTRSKARTLTRLAFNGVVVRRTGFTIRNLATVD
jgi:hypothetical protein